LGFELTMQMYLSVHEMYIRVECIQLDHVVTPIASKTISVGCLAPDQRQQFLMKVSKQA
jgi:hypothetical protein